ncbi:MAG: hypothetical protein AB1505_01605 [Candidatus Latescibacterota bacterium]
MRRLLLLFLPAVSWAAPGADFEVTLCQVLQEALQSGQPVYSDTVLARLAEATGVSSDRVRPRLGALLDSLAAHRRRNSSAWKELAALGGVDVPPDAASTFLGELVAEARPAAQARDRYLLDTALQRAAHRARIRAFQGRDYLVRLLERRAHQGVTAQDSAFDFLVTGATGRFEINRDPLYLFFDSRDDAFVTEQVREIHRFIVPAVVRELPRWERVRWAVRDRDANVLVDPDWELAVRVEGLSFTGTNADLRPCVDTAVALLGRPARQPAQTWQVHYCTERQGSATTHSLDPFYQEVASHIRGLVEEFLQR